MRSYWVGLGKVTSASLLLSWLPSQSQQDQWCLAQGSPVPGNWDLASLLPQLCELASALDEAEWVDWEGAEALLC